MRIKLHNSMSKKYSSWLLFDEKVFISLFNNHLNLFYRIDDDNCFLSFSPATKEFKKGYGFGGNEKHFNPGWWKGPKWNWEEMGK